MKQKRQTIAGSALPVLLLTLLLCVAQTASRPSTENEDDVGALPPDADNIEFHHVKVVNGVVQKDHPVIMYKEDFVSEDYDPSKNETKVNHQKLFRRHQRIRHHHLKSKSLQPKVEEPQEKIMFDVLPETPLVMNDDDTSISNLEVTQLVKPSKEESLQKYPKKYHSRQRRQVYNPYARHSYKSDYYADQQHALRRLAPSPYYLPVQPQPHYQRYPVAGKKPKYKGQLPIWVTPMSVDDRFGNEDSENDLFHNSNPDDADFSVFNRPRPSNNAGGSGGGSGGGAAAGSGGGAGFQSRPIDDSDRPPVWEPSDNRPWNVAHTPQAPEPQPIFTAPSWTNRHITRPRPRQDTALFYPGEPIYESGSACSRAAQLCCRLGDLGSQYDCFNRQQCEHNISEIFSTCS